MAFTTTKRSKEKKRHTAVHGSFRSSMPMSTCRGCVVHKKGRLFFKSKKKNTETAGMALREKRGRVRKETPTNKSKKTGKEMKEGKKKEKVKRIRAWEDSSKAAASHRYSRMCKQHDDFPFFASFPFLLDVFFFRHCQCAKSACPVPPLITKRGN